MASIFTLLPLKKLTDWRDGSAVITLFFESD